MCNANKISIGDPDKMSVQDFMDGNCKHLKVHILKKINGSNYVGGDDSKLLHIKMNPANFGELEEARKAE